MGSCVSSPGHGAASLSRASGFRRCTSIAPSTEHRYHPKPAAAGAKLVGLQCGAPIAPGPRTSEDNACGRWPASRPAGQHTPRAKGGQWVHGHAWIPVAQGSIGQLVKPSYEGKSSRQHGHAGSRRVTHAWSRRGSPCRSQPPVAPGATPHISETVVPPLRDLPPLVRRTTGLPASSGTSHGRPLKWVMLRVLGVLG